MGNYRCQPATLPAIDRHLADHADYRHWRALTHPHDQSLLCATARRTPGCASPLGYDAARRSGLCDQRVSAGSLEHLSVFPTPACRRTACGAPPYRAASAALVAETLTPDVRELARTTWNAPLSNVYADTEIGLLGQECEQVAGMH